MHAPPKHCHPERSEGPLHSPRACTIHRFFAPLRMTGTGSRPLLPLRSQLGLMLMPFVVLFFCLLAIPALAQISPASSDLPTPPGARVTKLTPKPGDFTEPSIAINPRDPRQLVGAFQVNASLANSRDAGQTWTLAEGTAPADYKVSGDVSVAYDNQGHAFLCYIAFDKLGTENYWAHGATRNGIFVRRSLDGGQTWDKDASIVIAHAERPGHSVRRQAIHRRRRHPLQVRRQPLHRLDRILARQIESFCSRARPIAAKHGQSPSKSARKRACRATTTARSKALPERSQRRHAVRRLVRHFRHRVRRLQRRRPQFFPLAHYREDRADIFRSHFSRARQRLSPNCDRSAQRQVVRHLG